MKENNKDLDLMQLAYDELIERYLSGQMGEEEESTFLEKIESDDELRARAIMHARLAKGMNDEITDALKQVDEATIRKIATKVGRQNKEEKVPAAASTHRWPYSSVFAIAASLLLFVFVGTYTYDYFGTTRLGKNFASEVPFTVSEEIRGTEEENVTRELASLFANVSDGKDLEQTTARLAELWEESKKGTFNDYTNYAPYIGWYLAIGYLKDNEKEMAKDVLWEMEEMYPKENAIGEKVRKLLREL